MSRGIKILWIVIGSIFAAGVVLTTVGFALGGTGGAYLDRNGIHFGGRDAQTIKLADADTESFSNIEVELLHADVEIVVAEAYGYDYTYTGTHEPTIEVKNGKLKITENPDNWSVNLFNGWGYSTESDLTVFVPSKAVLDEVSLSVASGSTSLDASQMSIRELECQSASGNVYLAGLDLDELSLEVASGDVTLEDIAAAKVSIEMASGTLSCNEALADYLEIQMASGNVNYQGGVSDALLLQMVSGDADFELAGSEDDYTYKVEKVSGTVRVNGNSVGSSYQPDSSGSAGSKAHIEVELTSGSVNFDFTE